MLRDGGSDQGKHQNRRHRFERAHKQAAQNRTDFHHRASSGSVAHQYAHQNAEHEADGNLRYQPQAGEKAERAFPLSVVLHTNP